MKKTKKKIDVSEDQPIKAKVYKKLPIDICVPNDWNPNTMPEAVREKVQAGIVEVLEQSGSIPPIVVRKHPDMEGKYQIIDGYHRWDILRLLEKESIDACILNVDTKMAMTLTSTLNYLRGEPETESYAKYLHKLMNDSHITPEEAAVYLPETKDEIDDYLAAFDLEIEHVHIDDDIERGENDKPKEEHWVELKVLVSQEQMEIIEAELSRIAGVMRGSKRNVRGRALEFMAVNSAQTPIENITGEAEEKVSFKKPKKDSVKKRLKDKAAA